MPPKVPKPVPLDAAACTEIRKEVLRRLLAQYPGQALVDGSPAFSSAELCSSYTKPGGISRWLGRRRRLYIAKPRSQDLYWSSIADLLGSDAISGTELITHPQLYHNRWAALVQARCSWRGLTRGLKSDMFGLLASRIVDWLKSRCQVVNKALSVTRPLLRVACSNLSDTLDAYGGREVFWVAAIHLSLCGQIVGDVGYYDCDGATTPKIGWLSNAVQSLEAKGLIDKRSVDRLLGQGKHEVVSPPLPREGQPFVIDICCGYMSKYYLHLKDTDIGYLCYDIRTRLWDGSRWLRPHVNGPIQEIDGNIVAAVIAAVSHLVVLDPSLVLLVHGSSPCTALSLSNAPNADEAYGVYGSSGEDCAQFINDVGVGKRVLKDFLFWHRLHGTPVIAENPAYGGFRHLEGIEDYLYRREFYCQVVAALVFVAAVAVLVSVFIRIIGP
jgi:hypothetical protein